MSVTLFYVFLTISLIVVELAYFRIASLYNIIDKPNHRSSHKIITIRGGGVLFPISILIYALFSESSYPCFLSGLFLISVISFYDDLKPLSKIIRLIGQLIAVGLLFIDSGLINYSGWLLIPSTIVVIGTINAYNFMDGINGITGVYSLSIISTLAWLNSSDPFIDQNILITIGIALLIFLFFNFRKEAKCFAGDVGSVSISFIILFALAILIRQTNQILYILFLAVYGVDSILTILFRLSNRENIFEAHRSHAYQYLSNELKRPQLSVSILYGILQLLVNISVIYVIRQNWSFKAQILLVAGILSFLAVCYISIRRKKGILDRLSMQGGV